MKLKLNRNVPVTTVARHTARASFLAAALMVTAPVWAASAVIDQVVAVVDNTPILQSELNQAVQVTREQLQRKKQPVPPEAILRKSVLDQLILRQAQVEQVKRYGIEPSSAALDDAVLAVAKQEGFDSIAALQQSLDRQGTGRYAALREQIAQDVSVLQLRQQQIMSRIKISERDIDNFLASPQGQAALGSQVKTIHIRIAPTVEKLPPEQVLQVARNVRQALTTSDNLDAISRQFTTPSIAVQGVVSEYRPLADLPAELAARISPLSVGQTTDLITNADGVHVLKLLDRKSDDKKALVQQYLTRHILIQPSEVVSAEDAKQRIDQIYARARAGTDFSVLASTYSSDPGSARNGGSLGWVTPGTMVAEFDQVMTTTAPGQISAPFQTQYGWHILKVEETRQSDMTRELQRRLAKQILGERQFKTEVDSWLREIRANTYIEIKDPTLRDNAAATPATAEAVASAGP